MNPFPIAATFTGDGFRQTADDVRVIGSNVDILVRIGFLSVHNRNLMPVCSGRRRPCDGPRNQQAENQTRVYPSPDHNQRIPMENHNGRIGAESREDYDACF